MSDRVLVVAYSGATVELRQFTPILIFSIATAFGPVFAQPNAQNSVHRVSRLTVNSGADTGNTPPLCEGQSGLITLRIVPNVAEAVLAPSESSNSQHVLRVGVLTPRLPQSIITDCNGNGIPDECDIENGTSEDCNGNGSPDECEPVLPSPPIADPFAVPRCRFLSVFMPPTSGGQFAIRVTLTSLHRVVPPYTAAPSIAFTAFEGQQRWVGPPAQYRESTANSTLFWGSTLQCTPHYQDWSTVGLVHVTGSEIVPSSVYDVQAIDISCQGNEDSCTAVSCSVEIKTSRWGDVETPFNPPSPTTQPDIGDISALVNKFRSALGAPIKARTKLQPAIPDMSTDVDFRDIAMCVDAFRGLGYPFTISTCP